MSGALYNSYNLWRTRFMTIVESRLIVLVVFHKEVRAEHTMTFFILLSRTKSHIEARPEACC